MVSAQRSAAPRLRLRALPRDKTEFLPSAALTWRAVRICPGALSARFGAVTGARRPHARQADAQFGGRRSILDAMMRSQASAISNPPPMATPLTAAMIGCRSRTGRQPGKIRLSGRAAAGPPAISGRLPGAERTCRRRR